MAGSQDTTAVRLTWLATQAAAWSRTIVRALGAPESVPLLAVGAPFSVCPDSTIVSAPTVLSVITEMSTPAI
jgi:hypothetical protein